MGPSLVFYGSAHPKEGPMEGNPKARKVPAQDRLPCSRHFLGGGGSLFQHGCVLAFVVRAARAGKARQCHSFMGLTLEIITGALLLACAVVAVWMAGAIYYDVCGG